MSKISRHEVIEECAYSGIVEAGDFVFLSFCEGNAGQSFEAQVNGALDDMRRRLEMAGLSLESVVKLDVLLQDRQHIPIMERVFQQRFNGKYPARKTISNDFANNSGAGGLQIQIDAIAYKG
ncbi:MAG: RidA family protein [Clostridiales bacterium]|nr:RidA family protein [Clostridiales bacterium]